MEVYFDTDYLTVKYDPVHHIVVSIAKVPPTSTEFRNGMMAILGAMQQFKTGRIVCDVVHLGAMLEENQIWAVKEWRPLAVAAGHSKAAFIVPNDIFTSMSVDDMLSMADKDVSTAYFNRMEDAIRWVTIPQYTTGIKTEALKSKTEL